jgi:hypothetical protein
MLVPFIEIPVGSGINLTNSFNELPLTPVFSPGVQNDLKTVENSYSIQNILPYLFLFVSATLLIRFTYNFSMILWKAMKCSRIKMQNSTLILVEERTLPYSFFKYIFVNKHYYEDGKIDNVLLIHEEAHCLQYHSADIVLIELLEIFFWFNPVIWLFRREILLNHEYYADNKVLESNDAIVYSELLTNLVIQNNTNYLTSNFKYSAFKNRLIMMTSEKPSGNTILTKIAIVPVLLLLIIPLTFSQETARQSKMVDFSGKWVLNKAQSVSLLADVATSTIIIDQSGNRINMDITITPKDGKPIKRTEKYVFNLSLQSVPDSDNKSTRIECTSSSDGKSFSVVETHFYNENGTKKESKRISNYSLGNRGKTLIIRQDDTLPDGSNSQNGETRIYDRAN